MNVISLLNKISNLSYKPFLKVSEYSGTFSFLLLAITIMSLIMLAMVSSVLLHPSIMVKLPFIALAFLLLKGAHTSVITESIKGEHESIN
jgi:uncharacterized membrane-anchored protein